MGISKINTLSHQIEAEREEAKEQKPYKRRKLDADSKCEVYLNRSFRLNK